MGYHNTVLPGVIQRNILENPVLTIRAHSHRAVVTSLLSCLIAMIGSLPFHAWLNWVWYKRVATQPYEDFFKSFLRKYWVGSTVYLLLIYLLYVAYFILEIRSNGGKTSTFFSVMELLPFFILWTSYVPLGWWIIKRLKGAMQPSETDV